MFPTASSDEKQFSLYHRHPVRYDLYEDSMSFEPKWVVHPEEAQRFDLGCLYLFDDGQEPSGPTGEKLVVSCVNDLIETDISLSAGSDVFVIGYPFGPEPMPIWKRASVASEPILTRRGTIPFFQVDTATRQGLSGSPVWQVALGTYQNERGGHDTAINGALSRLLGVYSGRRASAGGADAQIGIVWPNSLVVEALSARSTGLPQAELTPQTLPSLRIEDV